MEPQMLFLMYLKSKQILKTQFQPTNNSWIEQAFAEDGEGPLEGFALPPRTYSCTFCSREFRSAQALGGHMNVHRRDRARLKQSSLSPPPEFQPKTPTPHSPKVGDSCCSSLSSPSRVSPIVSTSPLASVDDSSTCLRLSYSNSARPKDRSKELVRLDHAETTQQSHRWNSVSTSTDTRLSVGFSVVTESCNLRYKSDNEEAASSKRQRKNNDITSVPFLKRSCASNTRYPFQSDMLRSKTSSSIEESIDLELRLGDPPAVK